MAEFLKTLKAQGCEVTQRKLNGGFVNEVYLVTAKKGKETNEFVLKRYESQKDVEETMRGYNLLASTVKTPTIIYHKDKEIVYDLVHGKNVRDMILEHDSEAPEAIGLLAKELERLHQKQRGPARSLNSPDEKKMIKHAMTALSNDQLSYGDTQRILREIEEYVPKFQSVIHGDAHLGNFMYGDGHIYLIDPDNVKISDYNADLGKVIHEINRLSSEGSITEEQARNLNDLFLDNYEGEDSRGIQLHRLRTPLIQLKNRGVDYARKAVRKNLEQRLAAAIILIILFSGLFVNRNNITGMVTGSVGSTIEYGLFIILLLLIIFLYKEGHNTFRK